MHQPPPAIVLLAAETSTRAIEGQARAQNLLRLCQSFIALRSILHALQQRHQIKDCVCGPLVRRDVDTVQHARAGLAGQCQRRNRRQLAHFQILAGTPEVTLNAAFHKGDQAIFHAATLCSGNHIALVHALRQGRHVQQVCGQRIAAAASCAFLQREVAGQTIAVQIVGQLGHGAGPQLRAVHAHGLAGCLLQARVWVTRPPVTHAGQTFGQLGHQRHLQTATAGQCICRRRHRHGEVAIHLNQSGLLHAQRHSGHDALADLEGILRSVRATAGIAGRDFPDQRFGTCARELGRSLHIPGHFTRFARRNFHRLGLEFQQRGTRCDFHLHGLGRCVAQRDLGAEQIVLAHQRRQAANDLQILRGANCHLTGAEQAGACIGHGHHLEGGQRIVQWHIDQCQPVSVQRHIGHPHKQGVEQFTRGAAATATARRNGFLAVVAATDDFHLRRRCLHAPVAARHHGVHQAPAAVGHQLQQGLIDCRQCHMGTGSGLAIRQRALDGDLGCAAHLVAALVRCDLHINGVALQAHADFGHAEAESRLGQVHHRSRCNVFLAVIPEGTPPLQWRLEAPGKEAVPGHFHQAATQGQHADVHVRTPVFLNLQLDRGVLTRQLHHLGADDAFTLDRHQRRGAAERHAHLKARCLAGLVALALRQHIHAVMIFAAEPQFALARHPHRCRGLRAAAILVRGANNQFHLASLRQLCFALQHAMAVRCARAHGTQRLQRGLVVIAVETTHQTLAAGSGDTRHGFNLDGHTRRNLACGIQRQRLEAELAVHRHPAFGTHTRHHSRRPDGARAAQGLHFAIGVRVSGFHQQLTRLCGLGQLVDGDLAQTVLVQRHGQLISHHLGVIAGRGFLVVAAAHILCAARRVEAETFPARKINRLATCQSRNLDGQIRGSTARDVVDLHLGRHAGHGIKRILASRAHAPFHDGQTELFNPEDAGAEAGAATTAIGVTQFYRVFAQLGGLGNGELAVGAAIALPAQGLRETLAAAQMGNGELVRVAGGQHKTIVLAARADQIPHQVLHGHGLARAEQHAVENRVRHFITLVAGAGGGIEAPWLDTLLPVAPDKCHVIRNTGADKVITAMAVIALAFAARRAGVQPLEGHHALFVGHSRCNGLTVAAGDLDRSTGHNLALVQRSHPGDGVFTPQLEVHRQIGHQYRGAYIHGAACAIALVQQRLAQHGRSNFNHLEARADRDAHHLERTGVPLGSLGHFQGLDLALAIQQRQHARLHPVLFVLDDWRQNTHITRCLLALYAIAIVAINLVQPGDDVGV